MDVWLAIALLGAVIDATLTLSAGARYSGGWHAGRLASMMSSNTVLGMLVYETSGLYRTLTETHRKLLEPSVRDGLTCVLIARTSGSVFSTGTSTGGSLAIRCVC
jgi:hypothetical protein